MQPKQNLIENDRSLQYFLINIKANKFSKAILLQIFYKIIYFLSKGQI